MNKGKFLVLGGLDQTGKSTQAANLVDYLQEHGIPAIATFEPGGTLFGGRMRKELLMNKDLSPKTQLLMYQAIREEHLEKVIRPNLEQGVTVITDRFFESTFLFQGMQGLDDQFLVQMHHNLGQDDPSPDFWFLFKGKVGHRGKEEQTHYDLFVDQFRVEMEHRLDLFASKIPSSKAKIIDVTGKTPFDVFFNLTKILQSLFPTLSKERYIA